MCESSRRVAQFFRRGDVVSCHAALLGALRRRCARAAHRRCSRRGRSAAYGELGSRNYHAITAGALRYTRPSSALGDAHERGKVLGVQARASARALARVRFDHASIIHVNVCAAAPLSRGQCEPIFHVFASWMHDGGRRQRASARAQNLAIRMLSIGRCTTTHALHTGARRCARAQQSRHERPGHFLAPPIRSPLYAASLQLSPFAVPRPRPPGAHRQGGTRPSGTSTAPAAARGAQRRADGAASPPSRSASKGATGAGSDERAARCARGRAASVARDVVERRPWTRMGDGPCRRPRQCRRRRADALRGAMAPAPGNAGECAMVVDDVVRRSAMTCAQLMIHIGAPRVRSLAHHRHARPALARVEQERRESLSTCTSCSECTIQWSRLPPLLRAVRPPRRRELRAHHALAAARRRVGRQARVMRRFEHRRRGAARRPAVVSTP